VHYRSRAVFILAGLAVASGAAAMIPWQTWKPTAACLLCEAPAPDRAPAASAEAAKGSGGGLGAYARSSASTFTPGPLAPASSTGDASNSGSFASRSGSAPRGWQPWGNGSSGLRNASGASSGTSIALGGMWRLMSMSRPATPGSDVAAVANHVAAAARPARQAKPAPTPVARKPAPPSTSPAPAAATVPTTVIASTDPAPAIGFAPPTDSFHEHQSPAPNPFGGAPGGSGGFDPGTPGGGGPGGGVGSVSATPEPASFLLLGTGFLGILGVLRKRRAL
jgi:hypothetical protein